MLFSYKCKNILQFIKRSIASSLQVRRTPIRKQKKAPFFASFAGTWESGTMTVEAALAFPLLLFVSFAMIYVMIIMQVQFRIQNAIQETARGMAKYAYVYEQLEFLSGTEEEQIQEQAEIGLKQLLYHGFSDMAALAAIREEAGRDWLDSSCIRGGSSGLYLLSPEVLSTDYMIDITVRYVVDLPYMPGESYGLEMVQRCRLKAWVGYFEKGEVQNETSEEMVYITETGKVYHRNRNCSHLNLSIREAEFFQLDLLRNSAGGKYRECERCVKHTGQIAQNTVMYITKSGDRYHLYRECSGLKRTVSKIPLSEIGDKSACTRCST